MEQRERKEGNGGGRGGGTRRGVRSGRGEARTREKTEDNKIKKAREGTCDQLEKVTNTFPGRLIDT